MPSLTETVNAHIRAAQADIHTSIPARVLSYDPTRQTVDVQVDINHLLPSNEVLERGAIRGVPVQFGGTTRTLMSFPIKKGDTGTLHFQERSTDEWTQQQPTQGEQKGVFAKDRRMHDYSDCIFVPGVHPYARSPVGGRGHVYQHDPNQDTVIKHNIGTPAECYMFMKPDGSIIFQNKEVHMQLLVDGTVKLDCKKVIVNAADNINMTTQAFTIDCDTLDITAATSFGLTTIDSVIDATASYTLTTVTNTLNSTTTTTYGTITNNGVSIDNTHIHYDPTDSYVFTGIPV
mgnify:CR=1 FL=1